MTNTIALDSICRGDRFRMDDDPTVFVMDVALHNEDGTTDLYFNPVEDPRRIVHRAVRVWAVAFYAA